MRTVVIGAGVAGMSAALLLSLEGVETLLVEKAGCLSPLLKGFTRRGMHFDTGFHFAGGLEEGGLLRTWLKTLGIDDAPLGHVAIREYLCGKDGRRLIPGMDGMKALAAERHPESLPGLVRLEKAVETALGASPFTCPRQTEMSGVLALSATPLNPFLDSLGLAPGLLSMLKSRSMLYGVPPSEAAWEHYGLVLGPYLRDSATVRGGGRALHAAFSEAIRRSSIRTLFGRAAASILTTPERTVTGVRLEDGEVLACDSVVYTGHPRLLPSMTAPGALRAAWARHAEGLAETDAALVLYGIADAEIPENTTWYSVHAPDRFSYLEDAEPDFCVMTGQPDAEGRRPCIAMALFRSAPAEEDRPRWKAGMSARLTRQVLSTLPELEGRWRIVESSSDRAMRTWIHGSTGSLYGVRHDCAQIPLPPSTRVPGLVLAGQNIILPGMLGCIVSGAVSASLLLGSNSILERFRACANGV